MQLCAPRVLISMDAHHSAHWHACNNVNWCPAAADDGQIGSFGDPARDQIA